MSQCYSLDAGLVTAGTCYRLSAEMQCSSGLWKLIAKNRKKRLALHTALRTVYQRRQLLFQVVCRASVGEQQWSSGLEQRS